jgi:predicted helicase
MKQRGAKLITCAYRPFDNRWCYFSGVAMDRTRTELVQHVAGKDNLCLNTVRQTKMQTWQHGVVSDSPAPAVFVEVKDGSSVFPLYLYPNGKPHADLFDHDNGRRPNLSSAFIQDIQTRLKRLKFIPDGHGDLKKTFGPEDVFHYIYAVLHAPSFRARYAEFLKIDFPRIPLTSDIKLFRKLCSRGAALVDLHLMRDDGPRKDMPKFPVDGDNVIDKVRYDEAERRVYVNKTQFFEPVPQEVWDFHIGGYRVAEKWLKDRRGHKLVFEDYQHYSRIVAALAETIRHMQAIDTDIEDAGGWPLT